MPNLRQCGLDVQVRNHESREANDLSEVQGGEAQMTLLEIFWIATICGGVVAALLVFDGTITIALKVRDWLEDRR